MQHPVKLYCSTIIVDENNHLADMENNCPKFFRTKHGSRETYDTHRGCLIVRNTKTFTGCRPQRRTQVYLYTSDMDGSPNMFCLANGTDGITSIAQAKRYIDRILEQGEIDKD